MAKSGAERQAAYRARQSVEDSRQRRISTWISTDAALALETLSNRYGVTMRGVIEMLLLRDCEIPHKPQITNDFSSDLSTQKVALLRNDVPEEDELEIVHWIVDKTPHVALPRNESGADLSPKIGTVPEVKRGGQYSLEL
jgi:hypothetical protein